MLKQQLNFVAEQTAINKEIRVKREILKYKRSLASKQPLRDVISRDEFNTIMSLIRTSKYSCCRRRVAMVLLYITKSKQLMSSVCKAYKIVNENRYR